MPNLTGWAEKPRRWLHGGPAIKEVWRQLVTATEKNDLLTYASAMCYQIIFALAPVLLASLAILGFLRLEEVWSSELAPRLQKALSSDFFQVVDSSAHDILESRNSFWLTAGAALALWYISGATRALMGVMNRIYETDEHRSFWVRMGVSLLLSAAVALCFGLASVVLYFGPPLVDRLDVGLGVSLLARAVSWVLTLSLLYLALLLFVHHAPARRQSISNGSLTAVMIIGGWVGTSFIFRWYVTAVADYQSVFGNLASIIISMGYLYLSSMVLIYGLQIDALVRGKLGDTEAG